MTLHFIWLSRRSGFSKRVEQAMDSMGDSMGISLFALMVCRYLERHRIPRARSDLLDMGH